MKSLTFFPAHRTRFKSADRNLDIKYGKQQRPMERLETVHDANIYQGVDHAQYGLC